MIKSRIKKFAALAVFAALLSSSFISCKKNVHPTGLILDPQRYAEVPKKARLAKRSYESLPSKASIQNYMPYPGNQGNFGTCVAWSTCYAALSMANAYSQNINDRNYITNHVFSPYYLYKSCNPSDPAGEKGMYIEDALEFMKTNGIPYRIQAEDPDFTKFSTNIYAEKDLFKIMSYATLFDYDENSSQVKIQTVKKSLSEHKPVIISFAVPLSFEEPGNDWEGKNLWDYIFELGMHAMVTVAYDDERHGGSFLFQNSWGDGWGGTDEYAGYTWVKYSDFAENVYGAYEMSTSLLKNPGGQINIPETDFEDFDFEYNSDFNNYFTPTEETTLCYKGSIQMPVYNENEEISVTWNNNYYVTTKDYDSYTRFQLYMTNTKPCYMYAFSSDEASGKTIKIFPPENTLPLLDYSENTVVYPDEETCIQLDDVTGTDYLVLLYSLEELNLESIMKEYEKSVKLGITGPNRFYDRVERSVGREKIINQTLTEYQKNRVAFEGYTTNLSKNHVMPVLIEINHVD